MRAYVLEKSSKTPALQERPAPSPGPGEVLVRVTAVSIHPVDVETRDGGNAMMMPNPRPFVPGVDFAGEVVSVGSGVSDLPAGASVFGYRGIAAQGAFAEQIVVPRAELARAPEGVSPETLATFPLPALCALQALDDTGLGAGATVLVHGGAGGVGSVAVQIFAARGLTVIATASARDADWVTALGASEVIDYRSARFEDVVSGADLVFDTVGGETLKRSFAAVREGGAVVSLGAMPEAQSLREAGMKVPGFLAALLPLMSWGVRRRAKAAGARMIAQVTVPSGRLLEEASRIAAERGLETRVAKVFPFEELPAAMELAAGGAKGRVVVALA